MRILQRLADACLLGQLHENHGSFWRPNEDIDQQPNPGSQKTAQRSEDLEQPNEFGACDIIAVVSTRIEVGLAGRTTRSTCIATTPRTPRLIA